MSEKEKLDRIAKVHDTHKDFDGVIANYTGRLIAPLVKGKKVLEAGCSTGVITPMLLEYAKELDVVEGSTIYSKLVEEKYKGLLKMHACLFEEYDSQEEYDSVLFLGVLHHLTDPVKFVKHAASWLKPGGELFITVPNMTSFHRELGVTMKVVESIYDASERNVFASQPGRFDKGSLDKVVLDAGLEIIESSGFFFKPFPHGVMSRIDLPSTILDGLFEMGIRYPHLACQLYIKARKS